MIGRRGRGEGKGREAGWCPHTRLVCTMPLLLYNDVVRLTDHLIDRCRRVVDRTTGDDPISDQRDNDGVWSDHRRRIGDHPG